MNANCDECAKDFEVNPQEKDHDNGIIETFFLCPHCQHKYIAFVTDEQVRKQQEQIRTLWDEINNLKVPSLMFKKQKSIRRLEKNNKRRMVELQKQVASG